MANLLIFGASRGTGYQLVKLAMLHGDKCTALVRSEQAAGELSALGVTVLIGDANNTDDVSRVCKLAGSDTTVISTLGGEKANYHAQINIINQAEQNAITRMLLVTSLGCGDSWSFLSDKAKKGFGFSVREKTLAEAWLKTSYLNYLIFRPGGLKDGEATHLAKCFQNQEVHGYIYRSDLAAIILSNAKLKTLNNQTYLVIDPSLPSTHGKK